MIVEKKAASVKADRNLKKKKSFDCLKNERALFLLFLPGLLYYIIFKYGPMYGVIIAFKDYGPFLGVNASPWTSVYGLKHFINFFSNKDFMMLVKNTLLLGLFSILWSFPFPIIFAVLLNEVRNKKIQKMVQTASYMPALLSVVVVCSMAIDMLSPNNGIINIMLSKLGFEKHYFVADPKWFRTIYIATDVWQNMGFNAIIYIAAITGIDSSLYEAAEIDGSSRLKSMWYITLPCILPTIMTMLILKTGQVFRIGAEKVLLLYTPLTHEVAEVFGSYVYRVGIKQTEYSFATAVGLFESVTSLIILVITNQISKKMLKNSLW